jgi:hypothetical protein
MLATVRCPATESRSTTQTLAPAPANVRATASPIPEPAPVTSAFFLVSLNMVIKVVEEVVVNGFKEAEAARRCIRAEVGMR